MIIYKKGSLFEAPENAVLVHSCNAQGVWGSGIAKEFSNRYPNSYESYKTILQMLLNPVGQAFVLGRENNHRVGCLITSNNYGSFKDSKDEILKNTRTALLDILGSTNKLSCYIGLDEEIHSCKFNSGLFNIPWEETEKILVDVMKETGYSKDWTIWSL